MSLTFAAGHFALQQWGFSAGDIAVLAGAGRVVGTWVTNQLKDQALLEFMQVDPEDLIPRRGLIETASLHKRWDARLTLLQNGNRLVIDSPSGAVLKSMGSFSWFMTIVTCTLDAVMQLSIMRRAISRFLTALFEEHVEGLDYLQRELPQHMQGWMSAAVVRNMATCARNEWQASLNKDMRLPGDVPSSDIHSVVRFLAWVAGAKGSRNSTRFETTSSDVFCIAKILQALGLDALETTRSGGDVDYAESKLLVVFNADSIGTAPLVKDERAEEFVSLIARRGMRVPLLCMQECVSLWPGSAGDNNHRRRIFEDGLRASSTLKITSVAFGKSGTPRDRAMQWRIADTLNQNRADDIAFQVTTSLFPLETPRLLELVERITKQFPDWVVRGTEQPINYLQSNREALGKIQALLLGYYYGLLSKIVDASRLSIPEVYGAWKWYDDDLVTFFSDTLTEHLYKSDSAVEDECVAQMSREGVLTLICVLMAGMDHATMPRLDQETVGLHGKISVVTSSLLGSMDRASPLLKFALIDTDPSAIPSNARGVIKSPPLSLNIHDMSAEAESDLTDLRDLQPAGLPEDFTSHIEPDWDNDVQHCVIAFRLKGRFVARVAPGDIDTAWWNAKKADTEMNKDTTIDHLPVLRSDKVFIPPITNLISQRHCERGKCPPCPTLLYIRGLCKATACLLTVYTGPAFRMGYVKARWMWPSVSSGNNEVRVQDGTDETIILYNGHQKNLFEPESEARNHCIIIA